MDEIHVKNTGVLNGLNTIIYIFQAAKFKAASAFLVKVSKTSFQYSSVAIRV
jgi:hypothetical protein